jgi:hypothetical protein
VSGKLTARKAEDGVSPLTCAIVDVYVLVTCVSGGGMSTGASMESYESATCQYRGRWGLVVVMRCALHEAAISPTAVDGRFHLRDFGYLVLVEAGQKVRF